MQKYQKQIGAILFLLIITAFQIKAVSLAETLEGNAKFPDFSNLYLGEDKCETFNRKMYNFNRGLNKILIRPTHILWASIMPKYGMDRLKGIYNNIEYPKRLVSTLIQKDFKASGTETLRFLANTTIGAGGMFDPAKRFFKLAPVQENMDQALEKCKCPSGPYLVMPVLQSTTPRGLCSKALDAALNPTCYIGTPILALIKLGFTINETSYLQPIAKMIESNFADPYDIHKKLYGADRYIKARNLDRKDVLETHADILEPPVELVDNEEEKTVQQVKISDETEDENLLAYNEMLKEGISKGSFILRNEKPKADIVLENYKPQTPTIDAIRTALFDLPGIDDSIWTELSIWNRSFAKRIKTSSVNVDPERDNYKFRYIMQKEKNSPVAIIYPSIGEGITSHHSVVFAKLFYDHGYSVIIQGSSFQWEFVKSMPKGYVPGVPGVDANYLKTVTGKIIEELEDKYKCKFREKVVIGTSFGALTTLFLADKEYKNNTLNITKFISINPPIELMYAMRQVDKSNAEWQKNPENLKERVTLAAAKVLQLLNQKDEPDFKLDTLPFTDEEAKIITGFIMHQKLSDVVFTLENAAANKKTDIYNQINSMNYEDYLKKYFIGDKILAYDELNYDTSLYSLSDYLKNNSNYRIYHTLDDYLVTPQQLAALKKYSGDKSIFLNNGSHLGFMYREEFINALIDDITNLNGNKNLITIINTPREPRKLKVKKSCTKNLISANLK